MAKRSKFSSPNSVKDYSLLPPRMPGFWSYSRYAAYAKELGGCAFYYLLKYVHKLPEAPSQPLERGIDVHAKGEAYLLGTVRGLPRDYGQFRNEMAALKKAGATPEQSITLTRTFNTTHAKDWNNAWLRAKLDAVLIDGEDGTMIDFKTGKNRAEYDAQSEVYALAMFTAFPDLKYLDVEYWFLDYGEVEDGTFKRSEYTGLKKKWRGKAKKMLDAKTFKPQPGSKCRFCPFRSDSTLYKTDEVGPCDEWRNA